MEVFTSCRIAKLLYAGLVHSLCCAMTIPARRLGARPPSSNSNRRACLFKREDLRLVRTLFRCAGARHACPAAALPLHALHPVLQNRAERFTRSEEKRERGRVLEGLQVRTLTDTVLPTSSLPSVPAVRLSTRPRRARRSIPRARPR